MKRINRKISLAAATIALTLGMGMPAQALEEGKCGPMDVVFVVDDTGSMGGAIANIKAGISTIAGDVVTASGNDYQMGLVSFKDAPSTKELLAPSNEAAVQTAISALSALGGLGAPEASDVALDAVVNGSGDCGDVFNAADWRPGAVKIAVMLTDNPPGGCDDTFTLGVDDVAAAAVANDASTAGIKISAIYNSDSAAPNVAAIMQNYATTTGGVYLNTPQNGAGTAAVIQDIIAACGSASRNCPLSQGYWKNHEENWEVGELTIGGVTYSAADLDAILHTPPKKGNSYLILGHQLIAALLNTGQEHTLLLI